MQQRKIPLRRCTGCNEQKPKKELVRVVRSPQGEIALDRVGKMPGRGAYLCPSAQCLAKARKAKRLERALEAQIPPEVYERIEQEIEGAQSGNK
ncbi:MAG TPA: YlxR family protein [Candidatus Fournierella pullicola]|uniref:YlxR family protein n=1 Tax=Candidatus Allofournierella pullicola TaxID=2838596 RepID=A0A9D1V5L7_9FIRM|nr:YlxR family protein [Candidatus Fournierella pullicola]